MLEKLTTEQIDLAFAQIEDWHLETDRIVRHIRFRDFNQAFGVMTRIALIAAGIAEKSASKVASGRKMRLPT